MSITCGFFNSKNHDRAYDATQFASIFDGIINDGVYAYIGQKFAVSASGTGMIVNVGSGRAWFNHTWTYNDNAIPLVLEQSDMAYDRIDVVVLEVNTTDSVRANSIKVITGVPAASPVAPDLINTGGVYQHPLAEIAVGHAVTVITQADITNKVGTSACPYVTGPLTAISADQIIAQWQAQFNNMISSDNTAFAAMIADQTAEFNEWFTHLHNELDENQAAHLQNEIDTLDSGKQNGDTWVTINVAASGWSGSTYSLETLYPSSSYDITDILPVATTTAAMRKVWAKADCGGYNAANAIVAHGTVPTIDLTLGLCLRPKGGIIS